MQHRRFTRLPLLAVLFASVATSCVRPHSGSSAPAPGAPARAAVSATDSVEFAPLSRDRGQIECPSDAAPTALCRARRRVDVEDVRRRLAAGTSAWQDGDALVFAYAGPATAVELGGGLQYPLSRVHGTDVWVLALRIPEIDRVIASYFTMPVGPTITRPSRYTPSVWRGSRAPVAPPKSSQLQGRVVIDTLSSRFLTSPRPMITYLPPGSGEIAGVVYVGDGGAVTSLAPYLDTLIATGRLSRVMLVGLETGRPGPNDPPRMDVRAHEYLWNFDTLNTRFLAHERFFVDDVIPWAESRYGAPADRLKRAVFGFSNSGAWAIQMGIRNPGRIGHVLGFSPGGICRRSSMARFRAHHRSATISSPAPWSLPSTASPMRGAEQSPPDIWSTAWSTSSPVTTGRCGPSSCRRPCNGRSAPVHGSRCTVARRT